MVGHFFCAIKINLAKSAPIFCTKAGDSFSEIANCLSFYNLLNRATVVGVVLWQHPLFLLRKELLCFAKPSSYLYSSAPDAANKNAADFKFAYISL